MPGARTMWRLCAIVAMMQKRTPIPNRHRPFSSFFGIDVRTHPAHICIERVTHASLTLAAARSVCTLNIDQGNTRLSGAHFIDHPILSDNEACISKDNRGEKKAKQKQQRILTQN